MNNERVARELLRIAKELSGSSEGLSRVGVGERRKEFMKVIKALNVARDKFEPTSDAGVFLSVLISMAVAVSRDQMSKVILLAKKLESELEFQLGPED